MTVQAQLEQALAAGRLSHAYLLIGGEPEEKLKTVRRIAAALNCAHREGGRACGRCPSCRQVDGGNHPDYHYIEPRGASIKIDQVRKLEAELRLKAFQGGAQVVVFHPAENLTPEAANSLLKILEEPPGDVYFFLLAVQPALLLPTIVSRCQVLRYAAEKTGENKAWSYWEEVLSSDLARLMTSVLPRMEKEEDVLSAVDGLMVACRDHLVWQLTGEKGLLLDPARLPARPAGTALPPAVLWRCYRHLRRTRVYLEQNANRRLALEVLLLNLHRELNPA
ncbi:DNA polymerase III subunit delta' [Moorellaceae bacterium AZ2]